MPEVVKNFLCTVKNFLLYSGLQKDEIDDISEDIHKINNKILMVFAIVVSVALCFMITISYINPTMARYRMAYVFSLCYGIFLAFAVLRVGKRNVYATRFLTYLTMFIFLLYGMSIGLVISPEDQSVTFMVMIVFVPTLFIDKPIYTCTFMTFFVGLYIVLAYICKNPAVIVADVTNAGIYGALGLINSSIINVGKMRNLYNMHILSHVSRFDMLTKMNNRNAFEAAVKEYGSRCNSAIACVYIDVNGLHELNNTYGHERGDEMLKYIASCVKKYFGEDDTFRIGGDEFVVFTTDLGVVQTDDLLRSLKIDVANEGYHIAVGCEVMTKQNLDVDLLIKNAEAKMYENKSQYYKLHGNDRRKR